MANQVTHYNPRELEACVASKMLEDKKSVFVGTGLPMIASMLDRSSTGISRSSLQTADLRGPASDSGAMAVRRAIRMVDLGNWK